MHLDSPFIRSNVRGDAGVVDEPALHHPVVGEELSHVVADRVRENNDTALAWLEILGSLESTPNSSTRRSTAQHALLANKAPSHDERVFVVCLDPRVHHGAVKHTRDEVVADAFNSVRGDVSDIQLVGLGKNGSVWVDTNDLARRKLLLDFAGDAGNRTTGTGRGDQHVKLAWST